MVPIKSNQFYDSQIATERGQDEIPVHKDMDQ